MHLVHLVLWFKVQGLRLNAGGRPRLDRQDPASWAQTTPEHIAGEADDSTRVSLNMHAADVGPAPLTSGEQMTAFQGVKCAAQSRPGDAEFGCQFPFSGQHLTFHQFPPQNPALNLTGHAQVAGVTT